MPQVICCSWAGPFRPRWDNAVATASMIDPYGRQGDHLRNPKQARALSVSTLMSFGCSPDGRTPFCGGIDGCVHAFETVTGGIRSQLGHHGWVYSVAQLQTAED